MAGVNAGGIAMDYSGRLSRRDFLCRSLQVGAVAYGLPGGLAFGGVEERWQIGCYTRPWDKHDWRVALDAIAEAGFKYVGLMTTKSKTNLVISVATSLEEAHLVGEEVKKRGLLVSSVYGGGIGVGKSLQAGIADLRKLLDNCAACGSKTLLMGGIGNEKLYDAYYKAVAECCDYAAAKGVGITVKPHGGLNATGGQCRKIIERVNHRNFSLWYDPGNIYYYSNAELDPVDDAPSVNGIVTGMCVKDYLHPKNVLVTPGTGMVDFGAVFDLLKKGGFKKGPLVVECLKPGDLKQTLGEAKKARAFLEELTGQSSSKEGAGQGAKQVKAGIGVVDITPPAGYRMSGYFRERLNTGTANPLFAKALVLGQGDEKTAMVFCDIIGLSPGVTSKARKLASEKVGIGAEDIIITATHTHTGPLYWGALRDHFHDKAVAAKGRDSCEKVDYAGELAGKIVEAICVADSSMRPVRIRAGKGRQEGLSFNRRFHMKDGSVRFNPGVLNADIVKCAGPVDSDVGMVFIDDAESAMPLGAIVNFALHLDTVGGSEYAADYPYYVEETLRKAYGDEFVLFFGTGTCGDINHIDVTKRERLKTDVIGNTLGETVKSSGDKLRIIRGATISSASRKVRAPLQRFSEGEIGWAKENIEKIGTRELSFLDQVKACKILAVQSREGDTIDLEVQAVRLSKEVAVVALPGEVFVDIGLDIKRRSPFAITLVIELSQDAPGYIPTRKAFSEGSYETVNSRIAPGGGEMMADAAVELLKWLASG